MWQRLYQAFKGLSLRQMLALIFTWTPPRVTTQRFSNFVHVRFLRVCAYTWIFQNLYRRKPGVFLNCARLPENMDKNRYRDVLPCESIHPAVSSRLLWSSTLLSTCHRQGLLKFLRVVARGMSTVCSQLSHSADPLLLADDSTRVVLQGKEDYINASHITVHIISAVFFLSFFFSRAHPSVWPFVLVPPPRPPRWRPRCLACVCSTWQLRAPCRRRALTSGRLCGSSRYTPSSCWPPWRRGDGYASSAHTLYTTGDKLCSTLYLPCEATLNHC